MVVGVCGGFPVFWLASFCVCIFFCLSSLPSGSSKQPARIVLFSFSNPLY